MNSIISKLHEKLGGWIILIYLVGIFAVFGIPIWVYLGLDAPDDKFWLVIISLVLFGLLGLLILFLIIYQTVTNSDISKAPWFKKLIGQK